MPGNTLPVYGLDKKSQATQGFSGDAGDYETEETQREHFHPLPITPRAAATITVNELMSAGGKISVRIRGAGQFGVFRKAVSDQNDWRLRVYADNDEEFLLAEFTG